MKKVLSLVLALAMVLGSFSFVSAAPMSDVTDPTLKKAVDRLALLEVLTGYPDGTFKPEQTITRAEFAAVAVRAKGLEDAANAAKGLATGFTDVAAGYWAAGYVGTAGKLGIVNGVGNGLFAPNAPVKYEEAVTMIVRALGYEVSAQTKGGYPYGYLIVANEIGLLDDVKGTQGAPASRGIVAQITDNALEIPKMIQVGFGSETKWVESGSKEHGTDAEKQLLLHDLGVDEIKGKVTNNFRTKTTVKSDEIEIANIVEEKVLKYDITEDIDTDAVLGTGVTAWAKDDVIFSISIGYNFRYDGDKYVFDEDQIIYDVAKKSDNSKVELYKLDEKYDWAASSKINGIYVNNEDKGKDEIPTNAYGRFVLNDDDDVEFAYLFEIEDANTGLVTEIDAKDLDYVNLHASEDNLPLDDADEIYVFNKDLSKASLDDIKENTSVFYWIDSDDDIYHIIISDEKVEGTLEAIRVRDNRLTVGGTNLSVATGDGFSFIFSSDEKEDFETIVNTDIAKLEDYVDEEVVVYKNLAGTAMAMITDTDAATSTIFGLATWMTGDRNPVLSVYTVEGKEVEYAFEDKDDVPSSFRTRNFDTTPTGVYFKVNKDGEIKEDTFKFEDTIEVFEKVDDDHKYGTIANGNKLYLTEDTVIIEAYDDKATELDPSTIKYNSIINKTLKASDGAKNNAIVIREDLLTTSGNDDLGLLIFTDVDFTARDDDQYGIVTVDSRKVGSKYEVEIHAYGKEKETYVVSNLTDSKKLRSGDVIKFELDGKGELHLLGEVDYRTNRDNSYSLVYKVSSKVNNWITTVGGAEFRNSSDTVHYSVASNGDFRSSASSFGRINKDSYVLLMADGSELKAVLDITSYVDGVTPEAARTKAVEAATAAQAAYKLAGGLEADPVYQAVVTKLADATATAADINTVTNALKAATEVLVDSSAAAKAVADATAAVVKAEGSKLEADIDAAQALVTALPTGATKSALQNRLNVIVPVVPKTALQLATEAVDAAVASEDQDDVDAAQALVTLLPAGAAKATQQGRLNAVQTIIDNLAAVDAAKTALDLGDITAVIADITLPLTGEEGTAIAWATSDGAVVSTTGTVTRPTSGNPDATVTLTATITKGAATDTKTFTVTVLAE